MNVRLALVVIPSLLFQSAIAQDLSIKQLVARPQHFNGKRVSVTGYLVAANEECCLYTTREAAKRAHRSADFDITRVLWIEFPYRLTHIPINNHYGRFTGTFRYRALRKDEPTSGFGQWGLFASQLDVTSYSPVR